ncbi:hypothetical protein OGAPHI_001908 [Ogataea philodendri]|uniref:Alpha-1,2-mannosyltransferase n=1 Tax=Ogataea philodendri TaxID=1378263 RepID=A0A9P8PAZ3_9ASCO|nr:uncharacterized protein OGAPHI_001908 [Ogataea philodendri]KAH3668154.1 hypothetical protein OGAPHI_001908 [Ogataea philodendri]
MVSKKLQRLVGFTVVCLLGFYTSLFWYEWHASDSEVDLVDYARSAVSGLLIANQIKELYFKGGFKEPLGAKDIRNMLQEENRRYSEDREIVLKQTADRTRYRPIPVDSSVQKVFAQFSKVLNKNKMLFPHPERGITLNGKPVIWETQFEEIPFNVLSENKLLDLMSFDDEFLNDLTRKHKNVLASLPKKPVNFFKGKGYVMSGGGWYTWFSYLSIMALRKTGSVLPVEVILPEDGHYERLLCDEIFPNELNAKCIKLSDVLGQETLNSLGELKGYQFKSFSMLAGSFEHMMYLDSDNFAVSNPDPLFDSDLYQKFEMITWPDFWRRTSSPLLYKTLGIKVSNYPIRHLNDFFTPVEKYVSDKQMIEVEDELNFHDRKGALPEWTSESGQLLINKKTHFNTLLLSLYYNFNGPAGYHPLLSQGGAGEGDKETVVLAAHVLKKPNYQVYKKPDKLYGTFIKSANFFVDSTIVQYDPVIDYAILKNALQKNIKSMEDLKDSYVYSYMHTFGSIPFDENPGRPLFYHIHNPKMNPFEYVDRGLFTDPNEKVIRNFGRNYAQIGFDIEYWIWETVTNTLCERKVEFFCFRDMDMAKICDNQMIRDRLEYLKTTGEDGLKDYKPFSFDPGETDPELDSFILQKIKEGLDYDLDGHVAHFQIANGAEDVGNDGFQFVFRGCLRDKLVVWEIGEVLKNVESTEQLIRIIRIGYQFKQMVNKQVGCGKHGCNQIEVAGIGQDI